MCLIYGKFTKKMWPLIFLINDTSHICDALIMEAALESGLRGPDLFLLLRCLLSHPVVS